MDGIVEIVEAVEQRMDRLAMLREDCMKIAEEILSDSSIVPFDRINDEMLVKISNIVYKQFKGGF